MSVANASTNNTSTVIAAAEQMRLARIGSFFPTRLSFMRTLLRYLSNHQAQVTRQVWNINAEGYGHAVYTVRVDEQDYSLVAFSNTLADEQRSDRVVAESWDSTYALYDGIPDAAEIERLAANVPLQEGGRYNASELVLSRANKSVRFFNHTVEQLAAGKQPDHALMISIGYLMRTTAVYGNGKFGIADRAVIANRRIFQPPFQAELLAVWLIRIFTCDLVEHIARTRAPQTAVTLTARNRRFIGIGNATGLGMAPFLITHPLLLHQWVDTRNRALQQVLQQTASTPEFCQRVQQLLLRAQLHLQQWSVADVIQQERIVVLRAEWDAIIAQVTTDWLMRPSARQRLYQQVAQCSLECQELMIALLLETEEALNALTTEMSSERLFVMQPTMTVAQLQQLVRDNFSWALMLDYNDKEQSHWFWYVSAEKLEPRLGDRYQIAGSEKEQPLDIARQVKELSRLLSRLEGADKQQTVAEFLLQQPQLRYAVRRVQTQAHYPYSEVQDNLIAAACRPIDLLRFKLSFFGASKFDPKSDLWTRITLFQGAPTAETLQAGDADDWWLLVYQQAE